LKTRSYHEALYTELFERALGISDNINDEEEEKEDESEAEENSSPGKKKNVCGGTKQTT
jgi:hypothetical protein